MVVQYVPIYNLVEKNGKRMLKMSRNLDALDDNFRIHIDTQLRTYYCKPFTKKKNTILSKIANQYYCVTKKDSDWHGFNLIGYTFNINKKLWKNTLEYCNAKSARKMENDR